MQSHCEPGQVQRDKGGDRSFLDLGESLVQQKSKSLKYSDFAITGGDGQVLPLPARDGKHCLFLSGAVCGLSGTCFRVLSCGLQTPF